MTIRIALACAAAFAWAGAPATQSGAGFDYQPACGTAGDAPVGTSAAVLLIGGAEADTVGEPAASEWFLERGGDGDYLVLRTGGTGGQASWLCSAFGQRIASAAELSIDSRAAANDPAVIAHVEKAEMLFIAGGDQSEYVALWRDTQLEAAINAHIEEAPIAGTSAGMAILGHTYYAPDTLGILSSELLDDPYDPLASEIGQGDFIRHGLLAGTVTDTHLDRLHGPGDEFRYGRLFGLLARLVASDPGVGRERAIGAEEGVFIAIDAGGVARVFGPETSAAWFLLRNRRGPEVIEPGSPLEWHRDQAAVKAYRLPASPGGRSGFDLDDPAAASGGQWYDWFTDGGWSGFNFAAGTCSGCDGADAPLPWHLFSDAFATPE